MNIGIIILSAGNSSRLGSPKQLLAYKDSTLLQHTIMAAEALPFSPIVLVLGAYSDEILEFVRPKVNYLVNENWQQGISTSISAGLKKMLELEPRTTDVILAVGDQPHISPKVFKALAEESYQSGKHIIASRYAETIGTPVLFNSKYFDELLSFQGYTGARPILQKYEKDVATIPFELGHIDIDTMTDYNNLIKQQ